MGLLVVSAPLFTLATMFSSPSGGLLLCLFRAIGPPQFWGSLHLRNSFPGSVDSFVLGVRPSSGRADISHLSLNWYLQEGIFEVLLGKGAFGWGPPGGASGVWVFAQIWVQTDAFVSPSHCFLHSGCNWPVC